MMHPLTPLLDHDGNVKLDTVHALMPIVRSKGWPVFVTVGHLGVLMGQWVQSGRSWDEAGALTRAQCEAWAHDAADVPERDGLHPIGNDEVWKLMMRGSTGRVPDDNRPPADFDNAGDIVGGDWGGIIDLGVQFGARVEAGYGFDRAYHDCGAWLAYWYGGENPWALARPMPTTLRVEDNARWFANDAGRFNYVEFSAFSLFSLWQQGREHEIAAYVQPFIDRGATVARVIFSLGGDYWTRNAQEYSGRSLECGPQMPRFDAAGVQGFARFMAGFGLYVRACFLGAVEPFGGIWYPDRRDVWTGDVRRRGEAFVVQLAEWLRDEPNVVFEIANEPGQIGMRHSFDALVQLGRTVKRLAPQRIMNGGAMDGPSEGETDFNVRPFDFVDSHLARYMEVGGFLWVKRSGESHVIDADKQHVKMPFLSGEPVNFGEWRRDGRNGDVERNPSVAFGYGATSRIRQYNANFHCDCGLWCTPPHPDTLVSFEAFVAGLNAIPMSTSGMWRGHWSEAAGNYWRTDIYPGDDDPRVVEAHVRASRGPFRVFGCGPYSVTLAEPKGWDWRAGLKDGYQIERVAHSDQGVFNSAVYVRR